LWWKKAITDVGKLQKKLAVYIIAHGHIQPQVSDLLKFISINPSRIEEDEEATEREREVKKSHRELPTHFIDSFNIPSMNIIYYYNSKFYM